VFEYQKLVIKKIFYSNNNIYGKIMFSSDVTGKLRVHIFADLDDSLKEQLMRSAMVDWPTDFITTKQMTLKYESNAESEAGDMMG
jgi:hypothetical protein